MAELLLLNGADPLLRSDSEKCAWDEAKEARMKRLLERYVPKHQKHLISSKIKRLCCICVSRKLQKLNLELYKLNLFSL